MGTKIEHEKTLYAINRIIEGRGISIQEKLKESQENSEWRLSAVGMRTYPYPLVQRRLRCRISAEAILVRHEARGGPGVAGDEDEGLDIQELE